jgi:hypothetical protein
MRIRFIKIKRIPHIPIWAVLVAIGWLALFSVGIILHYQSGSTLALCTLKNIAGIPCPTCGLMRSAQSVWRGDIAAAFLYNPFFFCAGVIAFIIGVTRFIFGRGLKIEATNKEKIFAGAIVLILILANWVYLIIDGR